MSREETSERARRSRRTKRRNLLRGLDEQVQSEVSLDVTSSKAVLMRNEE